MPRLLVPLLLLAVLVLSGCGAGASADDGRARVVASFYPLQFLAERIGGPAVQVQGLTRPGAEPHDLELTPRQVGDVEKADLVVYLRDFQPAVDEAVDAETGSGADSRALDAGAVTPLAQGYTAVEDGERAEGSGADPHVWLDPTRMRALATAVADRLVAVAPGDAAGIRTRAAELDGQLQQLDADFRSGLATCARRDLVTSHNAFGYLAQAYGLVQVGITGLVPDEEPTPRRLAEVADYARRAGVTTIFFEETVSPKTAESLAREVGARAAVLSPLEAPPEQGDYLTAMRTDLAALRTALGCS